MVAQNQGMTRRFILLQGQAMSCEVSGRAGKLASLIFASLYFCLSRLFFVFIPRCFDVSTEKLGDFVSFERALETILRRDYCRRVSRL